MHSMGSHDGETASNTLGRMKMWARFLWGVALRETPTDKYIRELGMNDLASYFPGDFTAMNLFATGIVEVRRDLDKVDLGVLLHMLQDSFSQAHTERDQESGATCVAVAKPGRIVRSYSYARQNSGLHDEEDTFAALGAHTHAEHGQCRGGVEGTPWAVESKGALDGGESLFDCVFDAREARRTRGSRPLYLCAVNGQARAVARHRSKQGFATSRRAEPRLP